MKQGPYHPQSGGSSRPWQPPRRPPFREPETRRWPHAASAAPPAPEEDPELRFLRCSLSYQNQTLAEIKALLEQLVQLSGPSEK